MDMPKQNNRTVLYVIIGLAAVLLIGGSLAAAGGRSAQSPAALLSLGEKYLSELDYEQALVQFLKVIEIEPKNERAYLGAAGVYLALGQADEAAAVLERGLGALPESEPIRQMLAGLIGETGAFAPIPPDTEAPPLELWAPALSPAADEVCQNLLNALAARDTETAYAILSDEVFLDIIREYGEAESGGDYHFDYGDTVDGSGYSLSNFDVGVHWNETNLFYGGWRQGLAQGEGLLIELELWFDSTTKDSIYKVAQSTWDQGYANGPCEMRELWFGKQYDGWYHHYSGTVTRSLWHGAVTEEYNDLFAANTGGKSAWRVQGTFEYGTPLSVGVADNYERFAIDTDTGEPANAHWSDGVNNLTFSESSSFSDPLWWQDSSYDDFLVSSLPYRLDDLYGDSILNVVR